MFSARVLLQKVVQDLIRPVAISQEPESVDAVVRVYERLGCDSPHVRGDEGYTGADSKESGGDGDAELSRPSIQRD
jgi:hypothetical protein